jgi:dihydropteroate synthase
MGIVNVTPDSFSDGSVQSSTAVALARCERLIADGADILDIGGESTRPGAVPVSEEEELARVLPVLREAVTMRVPVSIDTYKPAVMRAALDLGVDILNDIWALRQPGALQVVAQHARCGVCLMHMHGDPQTMQITPMHGEVIAPLMDFLSRRTAELGALGVAPQRIVWDPGVGFGKSVVQNFSLLARQGELLTGGFPLLVGWSRKSSLGRLTGLEAGERLVPSVAAALIAVERGARILRVHDVRETAIALKVWRATISVAKQ